MLSFLVDDDLPNSLVHGLISAGYDARHVRAVGLGGKSDKEIYQYAVKQKLTLITADVGFVGPKLIERSVHSGIVVLRYPNDVGMPLRKDAVLGALKQIDKREFAGSVVIIEPGKIRIRKQPQGAA